MEESFYNIVIFVVIATTMVAVFAMLSLPLFAPQGFGSRPAFRSNRCTDYCPSRICRDYQERLGNYNSCIDCQKQGMCYSQPTGQCFKCKPSEANLSCKSEKRFGCENPYNINKPDVAPINPMTNGCQLCWKSGGPF